MIGMSAFAAVLFMSAFSFFVMATMPRLNSSLQLLAVVENKLRARTRCGGAGRDRTDAVRAESAHDTHDLRRGGRRVALPRRLDPDVEDLPRDGEARPSGSR